MGAAAGVLEVLADHVIPTSCVPLVGARVAPNPWTPGGALSTPDVLRCKLRFLEADEGVDDTLAGPLYSRRPARWWNDGTSCS